MKKLLLLFFVAGQVLPGVGQNNSWINFKSNGAYSDQQYYRIRIAPGLGSALHSPNGNVYRISADDMVSAGIPLKTNNSPNNTVNAYQLQLFYRGQEQYLDVQGATGDSIFANGGAGYIQFFATWNDGSLDSSMYVYGGQAHPSMSLFNDTASYYLTWQTSPSAYRYKPGLPTSSFAGLPVEPFYYKDIVRTFRNSYNAGQITDLGGTDPDYVPGEGFTSNGFCLNCGGGIPGYAVSLNLGISTPSLASGAPSFDGNPSHTALCHVNIVGTEQYSGYNDHQYLVTVSGTQYLDQTINGYSLSSQSFGLAITQGTSPFAFSSYWPSTPPPYDNMALTSISLRYPHTFDLSNEPQDSICIMNIPASTTYGLQFTGYPLASNPVMYDLTNHYIIQLGISSLSFYGVLSASNSERKCVLVQSQLIQSIPASNIKPVGVNSSNLGKFTNFSNFNSDYVIITHSSLMDAANRYAKYRSTKFTPVVVDVQELYDQFGYGVFKHPLSIRNFVSFALSKWVALKPAYVLMIGKSVTSYESFCPDDNASAQVNQAENLVPTFGYPPSDILLVSRISPSLGIQPSVPIGRISAMSSTDVDSYLQKMTDYEKMPTNEWMKHAIHLAGGNNDTETRRFAGYLQSMGQIYADTLKGGVVTAFSKNSNSVVQYDSGIQLTQRVDSGANIITFFGHAAADVFDYSLDSPDQYNMPLGRYSFFLANGCSAGDIHGANQGSAEIYVLTPNKGSIGFLSSSSLADETPLSQFSIGFYNNFCKTMYGQSVGKNIKAVIGSLQSSINLTTPADPWKEIMLQMTLEGDPALVIASSPKPDYVVSRTWMYFNPATVTTDNKSFTFFAAIANIGKATSDSIYVRIRRTFPDNTDTTIMLYIPAPKFRDTISVNFLVNARGAGMNYFEVFADATNKVAEMNENNNKDTTSLLIQSTDLIPMYPVKYAIISKNTVTLKAVTGIIFSPSKTYTIELDTSLHFNSPFKVSTSITQIGGVVSWTPPVVLKDSVAYFWRTKVQGGRHWDQSSFTYISGKKGWSQGQFYQFSTDTMFGLTVDSTTRQKSFMHQDMQAYATTWNKKNNFNPIGLTLDNIAIQHGVYVGNGFEVFVYDPDSLKFWRCDRYALGQDIANPGTPGFMFPNYSLNGMAQLLDTVPKGDYIIVNSIYQPGLRSNLPLSLRNAFHNLGSKLIGPSPSDTTLRDTDAYVFFVKKGYTKPHEDYTHKSPHLQGLVSVTDSIVVNFVQGSLTSNVVGPAKSWQNITWASHPLNPKTHTDSIYLDVYGIDTKGSKKLLLKKLSKDSTNINIASRINASVYPYLQLRADLKDSVHRNAPQLDRWRVYYVGVPEFSLNPAKNFSFYKDTMQEGENMRFTTAIENLSDVASDSVRVEGYFYDRSGNQHMIVNQKRKPLLASGTPNQDTLNFSVTQNTKTYYGKNVFWVNVNPNEAQLEQYLYNDYGFLPFYVKRDMTNPLMDVTFDGVRILDHDIVSARPHISIRMTDENKFMAMSDTTAFRLWLIPPGQTDASKYQIYFKSAMNNSNINLRFTPAALPKNVAQVDLTPVLSQDGLYTLMAEGIDASKNESGANNYKITFEVINKSTITGVLNYPNPFSSSTRFVFTLTGYQLPTQFKIQILTVTGRVVREIMLNELGNLHIGRNITDYAWDGKDQYGGQLANGLYVYRVLATINGNAIDKQETSADKYFVNGYGKMYLLR